MARAKTRRALLPISRSLYHYRSRARDARPLVQLSTVLSGGLSLRHPRPRRNRSVRLRQPKQLVSAINEVWSTGFVADALFDGRRLRALTVVDSYTSECPAIEVGPNLKGEDVVRTLTRITASRGYYNEVRPHSAHRPNTAAGCGKPRKYMHQRSREFPGPIGTNTGSG